MAELRALLSSHGLSADGKKPELVARLQRAASGGAALTRTRTLFLTLKPSPNPNPKP